MKNILLICLLMLSSQTYCQTSDSLDKKLLESISYKKGNFIKLTDTEKLPTSIKFCQHVIINYLNSKKEKAWDYFISIDDVIYRENLISIPLWHRDGLQKLQQTKDRVLQAGTLSGKDGNIQISVKDMKVIGHVLWQ